MSRLKKLIAYAGAARARRFRYGRHDCALFAAGWLREIGNPDGMDLAAFVGPYRTLRAGAEGLRDAGYADHIDACARWLPEVPVARAQVGDIAVVGRALGIVAGETVYVLRPRGLAQVPLTAATRVFRA